MINILSWHVAHNIWVAPWRSRSQHDLAAKSCPANNFVIWSLILNLSHRNDHHIETLCQKQHLGRYLEGQGHSMTLQQKSFWPLTLWFKVGVYNYLTEIITILRWCVTTLSIVWLCVYYTAVTKYCYLNSQFQWSTRRRNVSILYFVIIVFFLKVELIINGNKQKLMII